VPSLCINLKQPGWQWIYIFEMSLSLFRKAVNMATSNPYYVVFVELTLKPNVSKTDAKELLVQNAAISIENEPGCFRFDVVETYNDEAHFILFEIYRDENAFSEHLKTKHYEKFDAVSEQFFEGKQIRLGGLVSGTLDPLKG
jgi:autoinducer 2-degrading protein